MRHAICSNSRRRLSIFGLYASLDIIFFMLRKLFVRNIIFLLLSIAVAGAQDLKQIAPEDALQRLIKRVEPVYPDLAEMGQIQGTVAVRITIDENGNVADAKPISGHPLLLDSARTAVKQWKFQPVTVNGKAVAANSIVNVEFSLAPGAGKRRDYLQQEVECNRQIQNKMIAEAEAACTQALEKAKKLPSKFAMDKVRAYGNAGKAASGSNKPDEAVENFKQQAELAQEVFQPGNPQLVLIHNNLARAYETAGQMQKADAEYTEMEKAQESALSELESRKDKLTPESYESVKASFARNWRVILHEHAALLRKMGKDPEAQALEQRANSAADAQPRRP